MAVFHSDGMTLSAVTGYLRLPLGGILPWLSSVGQPASQALVDDHSVQNWDEYSRQFFPVWRLLSGATVPVHFAASPAPFFGAVLRQLAVLPYESQQKPIGVCRRRNLHVET